MAGLTDAGRDERLAEAARVVRAGGLVIYPTETFYGLGADALNRSALARLTALKNRPAGKPLPLVLGEAAQLAQVTDPRLGAAGTAEAAEDHRRLAELFWPGPLSILTLTGPDAPEAIRDEQGFTSARVSGAETARRLALLAGRPLAATSANVSGRPPAASPDELDPELTAAVDLALLDPPWPAGGLPSTVVRPLGGGRLTVIRPGAVAEAALRRAGFSII